ncbi:MAG TPA: aldo/keto reductase [Candidatus Binatia bacterium]|nr:aldo/keto reductase [Candidatus Binatia bacterium]
MEQRRLGRSGLAVSLVGLGCNNFGGRTDKDGARKVIDTAIDAGINFLDTADIYAMGNRGASETIIGEILGNRRKDIILATKFSGQMDDRGWLKGTSRRYIVTAIEASLRRLQTDYIDLYQLHFPDPQTPIEETLRALDDLVHQGKVRYIGCTNLEGWQIADAQWTAKHLNLNAFISAQDEYSLVVRDVESEKLPAAEAFGLGFLPYFPLASGLLTGKYERGKPAPAGTRFAASQGLADRYLTERNAAIVEKLKAFCAKRGHTMLDLAFSWLAARPCISSVIAGATRPEQIEQNVAAVNWKLSAEELAEIDKLTT